MLKATQNGRHASTVWCTLDKVKLRMTYAQLPQAEQELWKNPAMYLTQHTVATIMITIAIPKN
eukprot:6394896-Amphidinium_carterae.1